jgi:hypothetical protein
MELQQNIQDGNCCYKFVIFHYLFCFFQSVGEVTVTYYVYKDMYTIYLYLYKIVLGEFV